MACFIGGSLSAFLLLLLFRAGDFIEQPMSVREAAVGATFGAAAGALVESFDFGAMDNLPIVLVAGLVAHVAMYQEVPLEPKLEL